MLSDDDLLSVHYLVKHVNVKITSFKCCVNGLP